MYFAIFFASLKFKKVKKIDLEREYDDFTMMRVLDPWISISFKARIGRECHLLLSRVLRKKGSAKVIRMCLLVRPLRCLWCFTSKKCCAMFCLCVCVLHVVF